MFNYYHEDISYQDIYTHLFIYLSMKKNTHLSFNYCHFSLPLFFFYLAIHTIYS